MTVFDTLRKRLLVRNRQNNMARLLDLLKQRGMDPAKDEIMFDPNHNINSVIEYMFELTRIVDELTMKTEDLQPNVMGADTPKIDKEKIKIPVTKEAEVDVLVHPSDPEEIKYEGDGSGPDAMFIDDGSGHEDTVSEDDKQEITDAINDVVDGEAFEPIKYEDMSFQELRDLCKSRDLSAKGKAQDLIDRLTEADVS